MNNDLILGAHVLAKTRVRRVPASRGRRVECLTGCLWITQDGDPRDVVLKAGEAFEFDRNGAILSALDDSRYVLLDACRRPAMAY